MRNIVFSLLTALLVSGNLQSAQRPSVAVASSLQFALPEIVAAFEQQSGIKPRITYGSSGNFYRQIEQGAPFELFLSADESYVDALASSGLTLGDGEVYALGRLAFIVPIGDASELKANFWSLKSALARDSLQRFAIANPDHAPYGRAAHEALQSAGLWQGIQSVLVIGENASQAAQFAISGSSQGGLIAYALAMAPVVRDKVELETVNQKYHAPIRQSMVLLNHAGEAAEAFYHFLLSTRAQVIFKRHGFSLPDTLAPES